MCNTPQPTTPHATPPSPPIDSPTVPTTATLYFALEVDRYKAMNAPEICNALFCAWARSHLKLEGSDLELLQRLTPHFFIWQAAWKAKS